MTTSSHVANVTVKANTSGVSQKLRDIAKAFDEARIAAENANKAHGGFGAGITNAQKHMAGFKGSIDGVMGVLGGAGLVGLAMGAANAFGEMTKQTMQTVGAQQALKISLDGAKAATMGLVDTHSLTLAANKAVQLGVVKSEKEFASLAKTASKLGLVMGRTAAEAVDDLTIGLGRQSSMVLDNLGIILKVSEANETYAKRLGKTESQLTDAEKKQAFMTIGLEKAAEAADRSGVSLDNQVAKIGRLSASWTNLKGSITGGFVGGVAEVSSAVADVMDSFTDMNVISKNIELANKKINELKESTIQLNPVVQEAAKAASLWGAELVFGAEGLSKLSGFGEQQYTALVALTDKENERKNIMAQESDFLDRQKKALEDINKEQQDFIDQQLNQQARLSVINGSTNEGMMSGGNTDEMAFYVAAPEGDSKPKSKKGGKKKEEKQVENFDRNAEAIATGEDASYLMQETMDSQAYTEQIDIEIQAREEKIQALEFEMEYQTENADLQVELASRKYRAEQELLDFQIAAATTREEILELEVRKRRKTTQESQRIMLQAQKEEQKDIKIREDVYSGFANMQRDVAEMGIDAAWAAADGEVAAGKMALGEFLKTLSKRMALKSAEEFALAAGAAAGIVTAGLAVPHIAAGVAYAAVAAAAGFGGGALIKSAKADVKAAEEKDKEKEALMVDKSDSTGIGKSSSGGGSSNGTEDDDGVPTSYYDGGLYSKKPDRSGGTNGPVKNSSITINAAVLGATSDQVGIAIRRILDKGTRSLGNVK